MTAAAITRISGAPYVISDAVLALLPAAGGERETALVIAGVLGRAIAEGLDVDIGRRSRLEIAGVEIDAMIQTFPVGPTALAGVMLVCLPDEAGPWALRELASAPGGRGLLQ